jgi:hypothetical protein
LELFAGKGREGVGEPVCDAAGDLKREGGVYEAIGVAEAGEEFVERVEGNPDAVEGKGRGVDAAGAEGGECGFVHGKNVAVGVGGLAGGEFRDDVVDFRPYPLRGDGGVEMGESGKVVAEGVAGDVAGFPAAIARGAGREAGLQTIGREEAVGIEGFEVTPVDVLAFLERAVE